MSFNPVAIKPSERDKAAASSAMIAIQGTIPYSKVLGCVEEAIAIAREEGRRVGLINAANVAESAGWQIGEGAAQAVGVQIRALLDDEPL